MAPAHQLERTPTGWYCPVCQWTWPRGPRGHCPGGRRYAREAVPPALQTQPQLRVAGLQPSGPAQGCYHGGAGALALVVCRRRCRPGIPPGRPIKTGLGPCSKSRAGRGKSGPGRTEHTLAFDLHRH